MRVSVLHLTRVAAQTDSLSIVNSKTLKMPDFFQKIYRQSRNPGVRSVVPCNPLLVPIFVLKSTEHVHVLLNSLITGVDSSRNYWLSHLVNKSPHVVEHECSLPCAQHPFSCLCPEPDECSLKESAPKSEAVYNIS